MKFKKKIVIFNGLLLIFNKFDLNLHYAIMQKSSKCLVTTHQYVAFGRLIRSIDPALIATDITRNWFIAPPATRTLVTSHTYYQPTNVQVTPDKKEYNDILGRTIQSEKQAYDINNASVWATETTAYNNKGLVVSKIAPKLINDPNFTTTYTYDYLNRLKTTNNPQVSTQVDYTYNTNDHTQTVTSINITANQQKSITSDASGKMIKAEDAGGILRYDYDSRGNQLEIKQGGNIWLSKMKYDDYCRQIELEERNSGKTLYEYDAFGQLVKQTNSNGHITEMIYDELGRIIERTGPEGSTTYEYLMDIVNGCERVSNAISILQGFAGDFYEYIYDQLGRLQEKKSIIDNITFDNKYYYNTLNQLSSEIFPGGLELRYDYNSMGYSKSTYTDPNNIYYTELAKNGLGQTTRYRLANNLLSDIVYQQGILQQKNTTGIQQDQYIFNTGTGNLTSRSSNLLNLNETFEYDVLNRLTKTQVIGMQAYTYEYANVGGAANSGNTLGNIKQTDFVQATYGFDGTKLNAVKFVDNPNSTLLPPANISTDQQDIQYTPFNRPNTMDENGHSLQYTYGPDYERIKGEYTLGGTLQYTKYYLGNTEVVQIPGQGIRYINYIAGDAGLAAIVVRDEIGNNAVYPTYTDHLGSINVVTNKQGAIIARQNFDAWGNNRNPLTWTYSNIPSVPDWLYRGYTGHEHLPQFALINMNARLYDPVIGRMLSPDNFVADATSTQAYNRYSYANNNPLIYTDPDGNLPILAAAVVGAIAGAYMGGVIANGGQLNPVKWDMNIKTLNYSVFGGLIGSASGALSYTIAGSGIIASNTLGIATSSTLFSGGMELLSNGSHNFTLGFGFVSWSEHDGFRGLWNWKDLSTMEKIGFTVGALANFQDIVAMNSGTSITLKSRPKLTGHSEINGDAINISVGPCSDPYPDLNGMKWEYQFLKQQLKGNPSIGDNQSYILSSQKSYKTHINNVNGNILRGLTTKLNSGKMLIGGRRLIYGANFGCVNYTSRALFLSGVLNINAILPITAPVLLSMEIGLRNAFIYAYPSLITNR